jgi:hypothetical protein
MYRRASRVPLSLVITTLIPLILIAGGGAMADEGQWPPDQLQRLDWQDLEKRGLKLKPGEIWNAEDGGLMSAVLQLNGCSASFISPDGLIATNHHCAYRAIQAASTPEAHHLRDGFMARRWAEEAPAPTYRALILSRLTEVTGIINASLQAAGDDHQRYLNRERAIKDLVKECESEAGLRCRVGTEFGGLRYMLLASRELKDIRLVYAPPEAIGRYGGEVDNWMWPRHSGDFALLRAYVSPDGENSPYAEENVPYRPARHLEVSSRGVRPGDLVMVMGYPGSTARYLPSQAILQRQDVFYPRRIQGLEEWIELLETATAGREDGRLRVAPLLRSHENRLKNARGMVAGLQRRGILQRKLEEEAALAGMLAADPAREELYGGLLDELNDLYRVSPAESERDFLLASLPAVSRTFGLARKIVVNAREREKPDLERKLGYQERDQERLQVSMERAGDTLDVAADTAVTGRILELLAGLPAGSLQGNPGEVSAAALFETTALTDLAGRQAALTSSRQELRQSADPFIILALDLEADLDALEIRDETRKGALARLLPEYAGLLMERRERVYPDANSTLRLSVATVKGFSPADAVWMDPQTTLAGLLDKHTGVEPFDVPQRVRSAATAYGPGAWRQAGLDDLPLCFLSDADTTGGNSGSPVVDGQGRLVGLNFDRVWENIVGDYGYSTTRSRNVSVDLRYLLWMLQEVDGAWSILREIGLRPRPPQLLTGD